MNEELIYVSTPHGKKLHGRIKLMECRVGEFLEERKLLPVFFRDVDPQKDKMHIFEAWSIHPEALELCKQKGVHGLIYWETTGERVVHKLLFSELLQMLSGELRDARGRKLAWQAEFKGGETIYIKLDAFNGIYKTIIAQEKKKLDEGEGMEEMVREALKGFKPEFGNESHIHLAQTVQRFDAECRKKRPNKNDIKRLGSSIISTINASKKS